MPLHRKGIGHQSKHYVSSEAKQDSAPKSRVALEDTSSNRNVALFAAGGCGPDRSPVKGAGEKKKSSDSGGV